MPEFRLKISPDKMAAHLTIEPHVDGAIITVEEIINYLNQQKVIFGINDKIVKTAVENKNWGQKILVAEGKEPVKGRDGYIKYFFDPDPGNAPKEKEDGSLDFHNLNKIQTICSGERLAELIPPVEGEAGTNVMGEPLKVDKVKSAILLKGKNTRYNDDKSAIVSEIDGIIILKSNGTIEVSPECVIDGDIDHSTGDIKIKGDLIIRGDVKSGFKISASGNIEIGGTVEEATVIAGESVTVKGGFVGEGGGLIKAGGDVSIKFINRQKVESEGNIEIYEEAKGTKLTTAGTLLINKGKGIFAGGEARAAAAIEVNTLGSPQNVNTLVIVADTSKFIERIATRQKEIEGLNEKTEEISKKMTLLMRKRKKVGLSDREEQLYRKINKLSADIKLTVETLRKEIKEAEAAIDGSKKSAYLKVAHKTYPGVTMRIAGAAKYYECEREATTFKVFNGKIIGLEEIEEATEKV
ncbi:MAG: DUF342 domain-containing protein [Candidatus Zixiibacteriota bacterium]|nr:MAG: DUF342 domain-containing protein [candidate division Zixibacteria bacterium]